MAKTTARYETIYILSPNLSEEDTAGLVQRFSSLTESHAKLGDVEEWGKRRLAYEINKLTEGYYVLMNYESPPDFPAELERILSISDSVIRWLTICKDQ